MIASLQMLSQDGNQDSTKVDLTPHKVYQEEGKTYYIWSKTQANDIIAFLEDRNMWKLRYGNIKQGYDSARVIISNQDSMLVLSTQDSIAYATIIKEASGKFELCTSEKDNCQEELKKVQNKLKIWRPIALGSIGLNILLILLIAVAI